MKKCLLGAIIVLACCTGKAQVLKRLGERAKQKLEQKAGDKVDKAIDESTDGKKKDANKNSNDQAASNESNSSSTSASDASSTSTKEADLKSYAKYDFVPGNKIIFEDNLVNETAGEFPSLYNTTKGQAQVSEVGGLKVIQAFGCIDLIPRIKGGENGGDYLPDQFTIEYDAYFPKEWGGSDWWWTNIKFYDESDKNSYSYREQVPSELYIDQKTAKYQTFSSDVPQELLKGGWHHIAVAVNKNLLKVYINGSRTINTPAFNGNPRAITLEMTPNGCDNEQNVFIKNLRIAEGGIDLYKRATTEGRFIARGITFDYNQATLKPESMGEINRIAKLMKDNPTLKFEIGGHTDSDGDATYNLKLSQERADAVKNQLVSAGVDASRLTTRGYGKTKPMADNNTPEGKANNRRVEFVKI